MKKIRYLIGIKNNYNPLGNEGTLSTNYKSIYKIRQLANNFKNMYNHNEIYLLNNYSQNLCELGRDSFVAYIRRNCKKIL